MDQLTSASATSTVFFWPLWILLLFFIIAIIKRRKQAGKRWKRRPARVSIRGLPLACQHCKEDRFYKREALIGSTLVTFFGFHYFNQSGAAYTCAHCGHIHWFSRPKETEVKFE